MKLKVKKACQIEGARYKAGDTIEPSDRVAAKLIARGLAEEAKAQAEPKAKAEPEPDSKG